VKDLLQYFSIRNQPLPLAHQPFQQLLSIAFVTMRGSNEIHWNVRINQDHGCTPLPYPLSISFSRLSMSPVG
jgi:Na+/serine symporter